MEFYLTISRWILALSLGVVLSGAAVCHAQAVNNTLPEAPTPQNDQAAGQTALPNASSPAYAQPRTPSPAAHWLLGSAISGDRELQPLTNDERFRLYLRQTYLNPGAYAKRVAGAAIDQARDVPHQWGEGWEAYGKRVGSRYGQFVIQNTLKIGGRCSRRVRTALRPVPLSGILAAHKALDRQKFRDLQLNRTGVAPASPAVQCRFHRGDDSHHVEAWPQKYGDGGRRRDGPAGRMGYLDKLVERVLWRYREKVLKKALRRVVDG